METAKNKKHHLGAENPKECGHPAVQLNRHPGRGWTVHCPACGFGTRNPHPRVTVAVGRFDKGIRQLTYWRGRPV